MFFCTWLNAPPTDTSLASVSRMYGSILFGKASTGVDVMICFNDWNDFSHSSVHLTPVLELTNGMLDVCGNPSGWQYQVEDVPCQLSEMAHEDGWHIVFFVTSQWVELWLAAWVHCRLWLATLACTAPRYLVLPAIHVPVFNSAGHLLPCVNLQHHVYTSCPSLQHIKQDAVFFCKSTPLLA